MFAQANSEHCRHKIFNADWIIDGERQPKSLFAMIKNTYARNSRGVLSAYRDNAAVIEGAQRRALVRGRGQPRVRAQRRADRHPDEGRDAQPSDGDLAVPRRGDRRGRRDPRRRRDRPRRQAESGPRGLLRFAPAHSRLRAAVGARLRPARAHRLGARHHGRRPDRRGRVQQRIRPPEHPRLLPHVRDRAGIRPGIQRARRAARLSQADHDRGRPRQRAPHARREIGHAARRESRSCSAGPRC